MITDLGKLLTNTALDLKQGMWMYAFDSTHAVEVLTVMVHFSRAVVNI